MNSNSKQSEVYLSSKEAGDILGYTHDYVSRLCRQGHMIGTRKGREWFVKPSDLETFKQKHEVILQEKKIQLSKKLSQIRKQHEAQKRTSKQGNDKIKSNQITAVDFPHDIRSMQTNIDSQNTEVVQNQKIKLTIPKQFIAVCVLAFLIMIPSLIKTSQSDTSSVQTRSDQASVSHQNTNKEVLHTANMIGVFGQSIADLPRATIDSISKIGKGYVTLYEKQGEIIYLSIRDIGDIGTVFIAVYEIIGQSFWIGTLNTVESFSNMFSPATTFLKIQHEAYVQNVQGGYLYVLENVQLAQQKITNSIVSGYIVIFDNISNNLYAMAQTINSISNTLQASVGSTFDSDSNVEEGRIIYSE